MAYKSLLLVFNKPQFRPLVCYLQLCSTFSYRTSSSIAAKDLLHLKNAVIDQGNLVRSLKQNNASKDVLATAIAELKAKKMLLEQKECEICQPVEPVDKARLQDLLKKRFFYDQSFAIYGGQQGLYDFGPMGCAVQANLLQEWRNFFVLSERMLELDSPVLTPEPVLRASGHVARFTDYLVSDSVTGESFRADHLVKQWLEAQLASGKKAAALGEQAKQAVREALASLDSLDAEGLQSLIESFAVKSPETGNQLTPPRRFNLMLETSVGAPSAPHRLYLRPETAQGIFVNFRRLLDFNNGRLPMAVAQIGRCFRNEIAPRSGLTRLREFTLAEIEHFYDPEDTRHPGFAQVASLRLPLLSAADQAAGAQVPTWQELGTALSSGGGPVAHETLAYYLARVFLFLTGRCGVDPQRLRFRQHPPGEMAHYASDCWDAECLMTLGGGGQTAWVECVGCADRSAYDLTQHSAASGQRLTAERRRKIEAVAEANAEAAIDQGMLTEAFRAEAGHVSAYLASLPARELLRLAAQLDAVGSDGCLERQIAGKTRRLTPGMVTARPRQNLVATATVSSATESVVPCVVEPSFGVGRIIAAALEHNFRSRQNDATGGRRTFLSLPPSLAPYKCVILPMSGSSQGMTDLTLRLSAKLAESGLVHSIDATPGASIGKRYARNDQLGVPFAVTVDFDSIAADSSDAEGDAPTVTLRERDSMQQVRVKLDNVADLIEQLVRARISWQLVMDSHPVFRQQTVTRVK